MKRTEMTILQWLDRMPPKTCRLLARHPRKWKALTNREIAERSGLTIARVIKLSKLETWKGIPIEEIDSFREACGITTGNERRQREYFLATFNGSIRRPLVHIAMGGLGKKLKRRMLG
jgi:hypothetical protein